MGGCGDVNCTHCSTTEKLPKGEECCGNKFGHYMDKLNNPAPNNKEYSKIEYQERRHLNSCEEWQKDVQEQINKYGEDHTPQEKAEQKCVNYQCILNHDYLGRHVPHLEAEPKEELDTLVRDLAAVGKTHSKSEVRSRIQALIDKAVEEARKDVDASYGNHAERMNITLNECEKNARAEIAKEVEGMVEEELPGEGLLWGDTGYSADAVQYGYNQALSDILSLLKN